VRFSLDKRQSPPEKKIAMSHFRVRWWFDFWWFQVSKETPATHTEKAGSLNSEWPWEVLRRQEISKDTL